MVNKDSTILIVDDEINNIRLLEGDLEDAGYENFLIARDGQEAWDILQEKYSEIDVVLLDRMMPNMDGMEVMERVKAHPDMRYIPVVMQTAAAGKEQMLEGVAAGVYYYLTKPYDEETMLAIVEAAIKDFRSYKEMRQGIDDFQKKIHLIKESHFRIQTLQDVNHLVTFLAGFFPDPQGVILGISELCVNAIEHGNLGITYDEKTILLAEGRWEEEVERRLDMPENRGKFADVFYTKEDDKIVLEIKDQGKGFDWEPFLEINPERAIHTHGRGIAMARKTAFDSMEYQGAGNEVRCVVNVAESSEEESGSSS